MTQKRKPTSSNKYSKEDLPLFKDERDSKHTNTETIISNLAQTIHQSEITMINKMIFIKLDAKVAIEGVWHPGAIMQEENGEIIA